jgi:peptidoglycan/LPS O-acetylase OafA/YrhL
MPLTAESPSSLASGLSRKHIPTLDGLRAVAVGLVITLHVGLPSPGGVGVLMFFVLSGFLITWLLLAEDAVYGRISLRNFYFRRALRIFPAFYAYSGLALLILLALGKRIVWPQVWASLLYVNNYYQAIHGDPNTAFSHTWSLAIEEQFYLTWPALFIAMRRNVPRFVQLIAGLIVVVWVYRALLQFVFHFNQGWIYEAFDTRFDHLLAGCLLAVVLFRARDSAFWARVLAKGWLLALTFASLVASVLLEDCYGAAYRDSIAFIVDPLLVAALIPQLIAQRGRPLVRWLDFTWVRYLGRISYSLYLYQQLEAEPVMKWLAPFPFPIEIAGSCAAVVLTATLSYFLIERPLLRLKDRRSRTRLALARVEIA